MRQTIYILLLIFAFFSVHAQTPSFTWVKSTQCYTGDTRSMSSAIDASGNIYSVGGFSGSVDFDPNPAATYWMTSNQGSSLFIQKLDVNGNFIWVKSIGNNNSVTPIHINIDPSGFIYITGIFEDSVDFDPGYPVYTKLSYGYYDVFVVKLNANNGQFVWAKTFGGINYDYGYSVCIDQSGNVYTHGYFTGTADFDPGPGTYYLSSGASNAKSAFIHKLDNNGNFIWAKAFIATDTLSAYSKGYTIDSDSYGNIYCAGLAFGTVDFDPGPGIYTFAANEYKMYVVKLDSSGDLQWVAPTSYVGGGGLAFAKMIEIDRYNTIYTTGNYSGSIDFDPGPDTLILSQASGVFIQKLDDNGSLLWAKAFGNPNGVSGFAITTDTFGNVYSTGHFKESGDFDPGPDTLMLSTSAPGTNMRAVFLQKLNTNGDLLWAKALESSLDGDTYPTGILTDGASNVYATGNYYDTVDFDPGPGIHTLVTTNDASYVLKLSQCRVSSTDQIIACDSLTWINGITYHQSTQSAYFTLPSSAGCDSVICLSLNIPQINNTVSLSSNGASFISAQTNANYQWLDCNNGFAILPGDTLQTFTPTANGNYALEISLNGCLDTSACMNISNVSITEIEGNAIKLYPNPNSGKFTLDLGGLIATEVRILNSLGQEVRDVQGIETHYFDLDVKPGVYVAHIRTAETNTLIRFVVR